MRYGDTKMGGRGEDWASTLWSTAHHDSKALERLAVRYWRSVYSYIRSKRKDVETAKDLTQAFFVYLLEKDLLSRKNPEGSFRAFLRGVLDRFLSDQFDYANAAKRGGGAIRIPLEAVEPVSDDPEEAFQKSYAAETIARVLERFKEESDPKGRESEARNPNLESRNKLQARNPKGETPSRLRGRSPPLSASAKRLRRDHAVARLRRAKAGGVAKARAPHTGEVRPSARVAILGRFRACFGFRRSGFVLSDRQAHPTLRSQTRVQPHNVAARGIDTETGGRGKTETWSRRPIPRYNSSMPRREVRRARATDAELNPYREMWLSLTPAQRLRRSWRLRKRLKNLPAIHDAKTFPEF